MALALAEAGADVAVAARAKAELEETAHRVESLGRRAIVVPTDVSVYSEVEVLVKGTVDTQGGLHILVNNSGIATVTPLAEMPPEEFRRILEVNLVGVFNGCRAAAAHLIAQRSGKVISLASVLSPWTSGLYGLCGLEGGVSALRGPSPPSGRATTSGQHARLVRDRHECRRLRRSQIEQLLQDVPARRTGAWRNRSPRGVLIPHLDFMTGQTVFLVAVIRPGRSTNAPALPRA
jgi:2-deoxy-D-gluconate 3-dehydrogenase